MLCSCIILIHIVQLFSGTEYLYGEIWVLLDFSIHVGEWLSLFKCLNKSFLILDILRLSLDWTVCLKFFYVLLKVHIPSFFFFFISGITSNVSSDPFAGFSTLYWSIFHLYYLLFSFLIILVLPILHLCWLFQDFYLINHIYFEHSAFNLLLIL